MFENRYSRVEQLLHWFAFSTQKLQTRIAELEDDVYKRDIAEARSDKPVFITGLPRAGTTILLELCVLSGQFVSHTYRNMPFVHLPLLWPAFSARFATTEASQERAHGDGIRIDADSPEAFEEMLWKVFWKSHYKSDRIELWDRHHCRRFDAYIKQHVKKLVAASSRAGRAPAQYISKNNLNIARLPYLSRLFEHGTIIVPFRDPIGQAISLRTQHLKFLAMHESNRFARRYMEAIGHYDFGSNLKPVNFSNWLNEAVFRDPTDVYFWLEYWVACYRHLAGLQLPNLHYLSYNRLCYAPEESLSTLADVLELRERRALGDLADRVKNQSTGNVDAVSDNEQLLRKQALELYERLCQLSLV